MPATRIDIDRFLQLADELPVIDVRSEGEFGHAHFPGAFSLPLFTNEERKVVGTAYKQESREKAIKIGLQYFGPKMVAMVEAVEALVRDKERKGVVVYCWRGGMRSGGVSWLLQLYGFEVYTLAGGYKAFRGWAMRHFEQDYPLQIVGGYTGSGKTEVLSALQKGGHAVVDLEGLANHKGSAFGNIGMPPQPSQEQFENLLALALWRASGQLAKGAQAQSFSQSPAIWIEDESQRIGAVNIPAPLYRKMQEKPVYFLDVPFAERLQHIVAGYGNGSTEKLVNAILRIQKRLGGLDTKNAIGHIIEGDLAAGFSILLRYYDKFYQKTLALKASGPGQVQTIACTKAAAVANMQSILKEHAKQYHAGI